MKQKTLFACLAAFAAVFAFSACDGFDDSVPIDDYVYGTWHGDWELVFTSNSFTLKDYSKNGYSGWYSGWVEDGGTEGELTLYVDSVFGDAKAIDRIELEFIRRGSYEELLIDEVRPSAFQLEFGTSFWRYR